MQLSVHSLNSNSDGRPTGGKVSVNIALSPLQLNPQGPLRREPPRPKHLRDQNYEEKFDSLTVFYDCFRAADGSGSIMLGPSLFNLEPIVLRAIRRAYGTPWFSRISVRRFDRHSRIRVGLVADVAMPPSVFDQSRLVINPNCSEIFRGRRVVLTLSRDNELQWIKDWAHFFASKHGADAFLIYDNASSKYRSDEIREAIKTVPGVAVGVVVDWPFKYGPLGVADLPWIPISVNTVPWSTPAIGFWPMRTQW